MPSFLKEHLSFRRRSRPSIRDSSSARANASASASASASVSASGSSSEASNDEPHLGRPSHALSKSSSTLNSNLENKQSPPTTLSSSKSNTNLSVYGVNGKAPPVPPRPQMPSSQSNRYSISVCPNNNTQHHHPPPSLLLLLLSRGLEIPALTVNDAGNASAERGTTDTVDFSACASRTLRLRWLLGMYAANEDMQAGSRTGKQADVASAGSPKGAPHLRAVRRAITAH